MKQKHFIDSHKVATGVAILGIMAWYDMWQNTTAWVYFGLHGAYGVMWALKSHYFGDKQWEQKTGIGYGLVILFGLTGYWSAPYIILSTGFEAQPWYLGLCIFTFVIGVFFHFTADMQKHITLTLRPGQLITSGVWAKCRNPNYFGELLIYLGFTALAQHWFPLVWLGIIIAVIWVPNMIKKDKSLSRYDEFSTYKKQSKLLIPYVL